MIVISITSLLDKYLLTQIVQSHLLIHNALTQYFYHLPSSFLAIYRGCGICGTEQLAEIFRPIAPLPFTQTFSLSLLDNALEQLKTVQEIGELTGCTHAAAWLSPEGQLQGGCEDVGRHVALDKLIGLKTQQKWTEGAILVSSRASYEMVQKSAMCGAEILFAVSAATSLAVEVANQYNLTLVGFCRRGRATVFTHPQRLTD